MSGSGRIGSAEVSWKRIRWAFAVAFLLLEGRRAASLRSFARSIGYTKFVVAILAMPATPSRRDGLTGAL